MTGRSPSTLRWVTQRDLRPWGATLTDNVAQALQSSPANAQIFESRAHAHLKAEDWMQALNDAAKAIELEPTMAKAYIRQG